MGLKIKDLVSDIEKQYDNLLEFQNSEFYIDTSIYLYKFLYGYGDSWLSGFDIQLEEFKRYSITPVYILDSKPPKEKAEVIKKRKTQNTTLKVTSEMIEEFLEFMSQNNVQVKKCPDYYDAEHYCCWLSKLSEKESFVMTNDYDALIYGNEKIIRKVKTQYLLLDKTLLLEKLEIDSDVFLELCIAIGTDFNPGGIKNLGPKKGLKLIKEGKSIPMDIDEMDRLKSIFNKDIL